MGDGLKDDPRMAYWMIGSGATDTDRGTTGVWTPCNFGRNLEVGFFLQVGPGTHRVRAKVEDIERDAPRNPVHVRRLGRSVVALSPRAAALSLCRLVAWRPVGMSFVAVDEDGHGLFIGLESLYLKGA